MSTAAKSDDISVDDIAKVVQTVPATSAPCLSVANSATYSGAAQITGVREAAVRLGIVGTGRSCRRIRYERLFQVDSAHAKNTPADGLDTQFYNRGN
ncbi:MAG: HDOD domain-containing protein [Gammaproteobacteria bacterium]